MIGYAIIAATVLAESATPEGMGTGTAISIGAVAMLAVGGLIKVASLGVRGGKSSTPTAGPVVMFDKGRCNAHGHKLEEQGKVLSSHATDIAVCKASLASMDKKLDETASDVKELLRRTPERKESDR